MLERHIFIALIDGLLTIVILVSLITDLRWRRILNIITYPGMILGLSLNAMQSGFGGFKFSLLGLVIGATPFLVLNLFNEQGMGAGDIKLMAAIGALKGGLFALQVLIFTGLIGGVMAVLLLIYKKRLRATLKGMGGAMARIFQKDKQKVASREGPSVYMPYGPAIALGTLVALGVQYIHLQALLEF